MFSSQKIKMEFVDEESILGKTTSLFSRDIGEFRKLQAGSDIKTLSGKTLATSSIMVLSIELPRYSLSGSPWFQNTNPKILADLKTEMLAIADNHTHANLLRVLAISVGEKTANFLTELVPTRMTDLKSEVRTKYALTWAKEIASAMVFMHDRKITFQPLSASRLFVRKDCSIAVDPFSFRQLQPNVLAHFTEHSKQNLMESLPYLSPELFGPNLPYWVQSPAQDVYSFGMILYTLVTQKLPYQECSVVEAGDKMLKRDLPPLDDVPKACADLILSCWIENPEERPTFKKISKCLETMK